MMRSGGLIIFAALLSGCMVGERPTAPDSDTDGLPDEVEIAGWELIVTRTVFPCFGEAAPDPDVEVLHVTSNELRQDTDADGVSDFDEFFARGNPTLADTDGDGLGDAEEYALRADPRFFAGSLLALNRTDSDRDCLTDKDEVRGMLVPGLGPRTSDPTRPDSDGDGFTDAWEFRRSHSDPWLRDTDGDGASDRFDAHPREDLWMTLRFVTFVAKDLPGSQSSARIVLAWGLPTNESGKEFGEGAPFDVSEGQEVSVPADRSPGAFDVRDEAIDFQLILQFHARVVDGNGNLVAFLDLNPFGESDTASLAYDPRDGTWRFKRDDDTYSESGSQTRLETDEAAIEFEVSTHPRPS